jgi:hypothetical protein
MRLAKELGALKKLVSKEERKIINRFLDLVRESGLPQATAKKLFSALSSEKEIGKKVRILENFLKEYTEDINSEPTENFKQQNLEVILSQMFVCHDR